jgi:uncharacterized membrane protein YgcG
LQKAAPSTLSFAKPLCKQALLYSATVSVALSLWLLEPALSVALVLTMLLLSRVYTRYRLRAAHRLPGSLLKVSAQLNLSSHTFVCSVSALSQPLLHLFQHTCYCSFELLVSDCSSRRIQPSGCLNLPYEPVALMTLPVTAGCVGPHVLQLLCCSSRGPRCRAQAEESKSSSSGGSGSCSSGGRSSSSSCNGKTYGR